MPQFQEHINLSEFTNYQIGGPAQFFFEAKSAEDVAWAIGEAKKKKIEVFILGSGTNLLVGDDGFNGLVLRPSLQSIVATETGIRAGAGVLMQDVLSFAASHSLSGLEWAGGLPGTLGGAIRGNAGAFGGEIKDAVQEVESFNVDAMQTMQRTNTECEFSYRSSIFKKKAGKEIVLSATLALQAGDAEKIRERIKEGVRYRMERHPIGYPNIGSIFKNVPVAMFPASRLGEVRDVIKTDPFPVVPTAYLISEAGLKGVRVGAAEVSPQHPNFIVNMGDATAADVHSLIERVKREVKDKFDVELEEEVEFI